MISAWYFVACTLFLFLSAFFSAAEMAYSSVNRLRLESAMESGSKKAKIAYSICARYDDALSAILIGNNLVNNGISSISAVITILLVGEQYTPVATVIVALLVIIFGETMPKIVAKKNANRTAISFAYIILVLTFILKPVVFIVVGFVRLITRPMHGEELGDSQEAAIDELVSIIETVEGEGIIDGDRSDLLQAALDFSEISVSEIMTSRVDIVALDIDDEWEDILETIDSAPYSRLPVYEDSLDNIIGILYLNHFLKALVDEETVDIRSLLIEPCYVYKTLKLPTVLGEMRKQKKQLAIVTDEYGGSMGIVTMEDVLEQIVGDIWDETDEIEHGIIERGDGVYELDGDLSMGEFLELLEIDEDNFETESATVGGWTMEIYGGFPKKGDSFRHDNLTVTVLDADDLRVEKVLVRIEGRDSNN